MGSVAKAGKAAAGNVAPMLGVGPGGLQNSQSMFDPLDILGQKQAGRDKEMEKRISQEQEQMNAFMAQRPEYASIANADGSLKSQYKLGNPTQAVTNRMDQAELDRRMGLAKQVDVKDVSYTGDINAGQNFNDAQSNLNSLQARAFGTETSPWAQKLYDQQALQQSGAIDQLGHEQALAQNQQLNNLAMQGGLEGGSRERLAKAGSRNQMMARQGVFRQGQMDRLGIGINDEAQRLQLQTQMPGMNLQMDQYNTGLQSQNRDVQNQLALANQGKDMSQQQFNNNQAMQQANMWAQTESQNVSAKNAANQAYANSKNQFATINNSNLVGNLQAQNAYDMDGWKTTGSVLGNQNAANAQARQGSGTGGFFNKIFG